MSDEREGLISAAIAGASLVRAGLFDPATIASGQLQRVLGHWTCSGAPSLYAVHRKTPRPVPKIAAFLEFAKKATAAFDPEALTVIHGAEERAQPERRSARVVVRRSSA